MSNRILILIIVFLFVSCENNKYELKKERFSTVADTVYQANSTKIGSINRTFYHWETLYNDMTITQNIFDKKYTVKIVDYKKPKTEDDYYTVLSVGELTFENDKKFEWVLNTIDTLLANHGKKLNFWIYDKSGDIDGKITSEFSSESYPEAMFYISGVVDNGVSMRFTPSERDSLRTCYSRFKEEIN